MEKKKERLTQYNCCYCGTPFYSAKGGSTMYCPQCNDLVYKKAPRKREENVNSELFQDLRELEAYNKENNKNLSYGQFKVMKAQMKKKGKNKNV